MATTQQATSLRAFAGAMLQSDSVFAERLHRFEADLGPLHDDGRALLAQAAYFCWFHCEYEANLLSTCRAIGAGQPTYLYLCGHVTPARWLLLHEYVVGAQRWLGQDHPVPGLLDVARVEQVMSWLGEPTQARQALARLFLCQLVDHLALRTSFCVLTDGPPPEAGEFPDFSEWYVRPDGSLYGLPAAASGAAPPIGCGRPDPGGPADTAAPVPDGSRPADGGFARACADEARRALAGAPEMAGQPDAVDEIIAGILRPSQPPGMHRFARYQDIKLVSIGQLRWRADLPADDSRTRWEAFWGAAETGLRAWLEDAPPAEEVAGALHEALGPAAPGSRATVADFLLQPPPSPGCFSWLLQEARNCGATALAG